MLMKVMKVISELGIIFSMVLSHNFGLKQSQATLVRMYFIFLQQIATTSSHLILINKNSVFYCYCKLLRPSRPIHNHWQVALIIILSSKPNQAISLQFKLMTETADTLHNTKIKNFQQKILNQSFCDIKFYDKLADYLLECCQAEVKPNTLSLFSFVPLFVLSFLVTGPSTLNFILTIISILAHQLLDIANKKQAYRLSKFSLATYYIDHLFDSFSCTCLILIISRLLSLSSGHTLTAIFFFGMLPFYTHHLAMYNNQYMTFSLLSPNTEGLLLTKLLFVIGAIYPQFFQLQIADGYCVFHIYIAIAVLWLGYFLFRDVYIIVMGKRTTDAKAGTEQNFPLKNLFVIFMMGYLVLEMTTIQQHLLNDSIYFYLAFTILSLLFAHIIGNLVLAYGYNECFKQITLPFLVAMGTIVVFYTILVFGIKGSDFEPLLSKIILAVISLLFGIVLVRQCFKTIIHINSVAIN